MKTRRITTATALCGMTLLVSGICLAADNTREAALRSAEMQRFEATVNANAAALGRLLDEELEYVHSNGVTDSKQAFIESLTSGRRDYAKVDATIESIRFFGDLAIIRGNARVTVIDEGKPLELRLGYTDVWRWKDDRWQMTAWRSASLPATPAK